jgi:hypothetical protein
VLCDLPHPNPFTFSLFFTHGLVLLPRLALDCSLPTSASQIAGVIAVYCHTHLVFEIGLAKAGL